jgi:hypothetical protein
MLEHFEKQDGLSPSLDAILQTINNEGYTRPSHNIARREREEAIFLQEEQELFHPE